MISSIKELRLSIKSSKPSIGTWMQIPSAEVAEILASSNSYDWIVVDMEHGMFSRNNIPSIIRAIESCSVLPFVRLKTNNPNSVKDIVDCGFEGYIVPMVESSIQLKEIFDQFTYPPLGIRGVGFSRSNQYGINFNKKLKSNYNPYLVAMIETKSGLENIEEILNFKHLDAIIIGPYDLSASLDVCGEFDNEIFKNAYEYIKKISLKREISFGVHLIEPNNEKLKKIISEGAMFIPYSLDSVMLYHNKPNF